MKPFLYSVIVYTILCLHCTPITAQVMIGSNEKPEAGALLELKQYPTKDDGSTATKGLGMPRVGLTKISKLDDIAPGATLSKSDHTGLLIYNVNERGDSICPGLHVWTGEEWDPLTTNDIQYMTDTRTKPDGSKETHIYKIRTFGSGGTWMLENLRATTYADNLGVIKPANDPVLYYGSDHTKKAYYYPMADATMLKNYPERGLMYNWPTINLNETSQQGICPTNWHIPTHAEWSKLEEAIANETTGLYTIDHYTSLPWDPAWAPLNGGTRGTHGKSMKTSSPNRIDGYLANGKSKQFCNSGGFNAILIGYLNNGSRAHHGSAFFWSNTRTGVGSVDNPLVHTRQFTYNVDGARVQSNSNIDQIPVRCIKDE